jgi:hypothetical protein
MTLEKNAMQLKQLPNNEAAILARLMGPSELMLSPQAAEAILAIGFSQTDKDRMQELAAKARAGILTPEEQDEVEDYGRVGSLISILKSTARQSLKVGLGPNGKAG